MSEWSTANWVHHGDGIRRSWTAVVKSIIHVWQAILKLQRVTSVGILWLLYCVLFPDTAIDGWVSQGAREATTIMRAIMIDVFNSSWHDRVIGQQLTSLTVRYCQRSVAWPRNDHSTRDRLVNWYGTDYLIVNVGYAYWLSLQAVVIPQRLYRVIYVPYVSPAEVLGWAV